MDFNKIINQATVAIQNKFAELQAQLEKQKEQFVAKCEALKAKAKANKAEQELLKKEREEIKKQQAYNIKIIKKMAEEYVKRLVQKGLPLALAGTAVAGMLTSCGDPSQFGIGGNGPAAGTVAAETTYPYQPGDTAEVTDANGDKKQGTVVVGDDGNLYVEVTDESGATETYPLPAETTDTPVITDAPVPTVNPVASADGTAKTTESGKQIFNITDTSGKLITDQNGEAVEVVFITTLEDNKPTTVAYNATTGDVIVSNGAPVGVKTTSAIVDGKLVRVVANADGTPAINEKGEVAVAVPNSEVEALEKSAETTYTDGGGFKTTFTQAKIVTDQWDALKKKYGVEETAESRRNADWLAMQRDYLYANLSKGNDVKWLSYLESRLPRGSNAYAYDITIYNEDGVPLLRAVFANNSYAKFAFVYNAETKKYDEQLIEGYGGTKKFVRTTNGEYKELYDTGHDAIQEAIKFANEYNAVFLNFEPEDATMTANTAEKLSWVLTNNSGGKLFIDYDVISQKPTFYAVLDGVRYNFEAKSRSKITFDILDYLNTQTSQEK